MNPDPSKLRQKEEQEEAQTTAHLEQQRPTAREFSSVEELIRFDATQNPVPEVLGERLKKSTAQEPAPPMAWWRRLFCRRS